MSTPPRLLIRVGLRLDRALAEPVLRRMLDASEGGPKGVALREFDQVRSAVSGQGALAVFDAPWTPLYLACCFLLHPAIGVLTFVGGMILIGLAVLNERSARKPLQAAGQAQSEAYLVQQAMAADAEIVRAMGMRTVRFEALPVETSSA